MYEPIKIDGNHYSDGALIDFAPMDAICCKHKLDVVLIHHVAQNDKVDIDIDKLKQQPWSLLEITSRLMFRHRPWYLDERALNILRCPCGCGAWIIAVEPELPEFTWPSTNGGDEVQEGAYQQAREQLHLYDSILKTGNLSTLRTFINKTSVKQHEKDKGCAHL